MLNLIIVLDHEKAHQCKDLELSHLNLIIVLDLDKAHQGKDLEISHVKFNYRA